MSDQPEMDMSPGKVSWNELCTSDVPAAVDFYEKIFGWTFVDAPPPNDEYKMALNGGLPVAGLMKIPDNAPMGMPPAWGAYITVEDTDATVAAATTAGATVLAPAMDIPNVGRMAFFADPQGAAIGVITYDPNCGSACDGS